MKKIGLLIVAVILTAQLGHAQQFSQAPTNWISGYTSDGTNMVIPIAALPYLTAAQCSGSTGDVRQIVFAIQEAIYRKWIAIPATNQSDRISVARTSTVYTNRIAYTYTYRADLLQTSLVVMPE